MYAPINNRNVPYLFGGEEWSGFFPHEWRSHEWGKNNFPMSHKRYILIPPRVVKYPHKWVTKSARVAKPRVVNFVSHEWGYFATSGGIRMYLE